MSFSFRNEEINMLSKIDYLAIYVDGEEVFDIPKKNSGYTLSSESSCNNGVTVSWDDIAWSAKVNYTNFQNNNERTRCNLYFEKMTFAQSIIACANNGGSTSECMKESSSLESSLIYDGTADNNLRYTGANPNNYVSFNNELWRIIGVMENIDDGTGKKESRIKLIRNESIGEYSWDSSSSTVNNGVGVNEWSQADLMTLLNNFYFNSLENQICYNGISNASILCSFKTDGLLSSKNFIQSVLWHTGSNDTRLLNTANYFYEMERSNNPGKAITCTTGCSTDKIDRTTTWIGNIALIYPSDYMFATSGGDNISRAVCINNSVELWRDDNIDCRNHNWIYKEGINQWLLTPLAHSANAVDSFFIHISGNSFNNTDYLPHDVFPTLYLKSNVKIIDGTGEENHPFVLVLD